MKAESRKIRNCVVDWAQEVLDGEFYFYHWTGSVEASVSVVSTGSGEWQFNEALGLSNQELDNEELKTIMSHMVLKRQ